jgi:hypothetical protein
MTLDTTLPGVGHNQPPPEPLTKEFFERNFDHERNNHKLACKRHPVAKLLHLLPPKYLTQLETNEKLEACCRRPIEHDIEAFYSPLGERENVPDIYIMHCTCGRKHRRFCVGGGDQRPMWDSR